MNTRKIKKLVKSPALFFKDAINNRRKKNLSASKEKVIAIGISVWKRDVFEKYIDCKDVIYFGVNADIAKIQARIKQKKISKIYFWGNKALPSLTQIEGIKLIRVEDGFIRSIGLGAEHILPYSLCFDDMGIYYDSQKPSRLEKIIGSYSLTLEEENTAKKLINKIIKNKITKYNLPAVNVLDNIPKNYKKKILVIGQVEDDQSIQYGCAKAITNADLLQSAVQENRDALIFFRPHPDVQKGLRKKISHPKQSKNVFILDQPDIDLLSLLDEIDHVYTITSLTGFEALLRGKKVTTFGMPFYAGWGLTDDREKNSRRNIKVTIEHLFYCAYVLYPQYYDYRSNKKSNLNNIIDLIIRHRRDNKSHSKVNSLNFDELFLKENNSKKIDERPKAIDKLQAISNDKEKNITFSQFNSLIKYGATEEHTKLAKKIWHRRPWTKDSVKIYSAMLAKRNLHIEQLEFMRVAADKLINDTEIQLLYCKLKRASGSYSDEISEKLYSILLKDPTLHQVRYFLCEFLWETQGVSRELLAHIRLLQLDLDKLSKQAQMFICACYCELGYYSKAFEVYEKVKDNLAGLKEYFFLSAIKDSLIEDKSDKFDYINKVFAMQSQFADRILSSNSFAIVGNAPTELGTNNGSIIDSKDIVIRFNNYNISSEYQVDYGSKTNIWIKSGFYHDIERRDISHYDMVIQSGINPMFRNSSFSDFILDFKMAKIDFTIIPPNIYYELISELKTSPSAGLCILFWIFKIKGKIPRDSVFGFSFGKQKKNSAEHYFINTKSKGFYPHDWEKEAFILEKIIEG